ncbi:MAG: hypothetical protein ACR2J9_10645 [Gaiellales bacterium]
MSDEPQEERRKSRPAKHPITPKGNPITVTEMLDRLLPPNPAFLRDIEIAQSEDRLAG